MLSLSDSTNSPRVQYCINLRCRATLLSQSSVHYCSTCKPPIFLLPLFCSTGLIGHSDDGHFHVHLHSCVIGNRRSSSHTQRAFQVLSPVYTCVTRFPRGQVNCKEKKMLFCFFVVKLVGLFPLRAEHVDKVLSSC